MKTKLRKIIPRIIQLCGALYFILFLIDFFNRELNLINQRLTKVFLLVFALFAIVMSCLMIADVRRMERAGIRKRAIAKRNEVKGVRR